MNWFWLNIPLGAAIFLAVAGIPLWMVLRHPDARPAGARAPEAIPAGLARRGADAGRRVARRPAAEGFRSAAS